MTDQRSELASSVKCPRCQAGPGVRCRPVGLAERLQAWAEGRPPRHFDRWVALGNRQVDEEARAR